jgi:hypothetical protein
MIFHDLIPLNLKVGDKVKLLTLTDYNFVVASITDEHFCYKLLDWRGGYPTACTIYGLFDTDFEEAIQSCLSVDWVFQSLLCDKLYRAIPV